MIHIVLVEPEIPQNTGNISRTCAATGIKLHLIRPMGFEITESRVRRAGLDYWPLLQLEIHDDLDALFRAYPQAAVDLWLATTKAPRTYAEAQFRDGCWLFFGKETAGLPQWFRMKHYERCIRIPMREEARSLNLSNSVAILAYEALRQTGFSGLLGQGEMKDMSPSSHL
ncbi:MAG: tRNA (cytidine(34)-2'-O)-methyltransferase [Oscillospiraceae bacterium]|nr:tRNA (cytidine(34)-2'-O)-methyltransferase [Oscillospiraceae bacterium]